MSVSSRQEIRDHVYRITDLTSSTKNDAMVNDFINDTLLEMNDPGWAYPPRREVQHNWSWLKRKDQFTTVSGTEDYVLPRDVDRLAVVRQDTTPARIRQIQDRRFYQQDANPTDSGNPRWYRLWEISGVSTKLAAADTIDVVSDSSSDSGDSDLSVTVWGYSGDILRYETYALNGTTAVTGSITFDADDIWVSKQKNTTGTITVRENSGSTTLVQLAPQDRNPHFKVMSLYPIPNAAIDVYIEYYTRVRLLNNDSDVPEFDQKWHHAVVKGVVAKIYQHLGKETERQSAVALYRSVVRSMVASDSSVGDYIPFLERHRPIPPIRIKRSEDAIT